MTKKAGGSFDLVEYGIDLKRRIISLESQRVTASNESGVDAELANKAVKAIMLLDEEPTKPINFILNNPGGDEFACAAIFDAIKLAKSETIITVYGMAMSAGSIILQAAKKRILAPSSWVMIHKGSWSYGGHPEDMYRWAEVGKRLDKWMIDIYLERMKEKNPKLTYEEVNKLVMFDTVLNAEEAVALGLADEVLK